MDNNNYHKDRVNVLLLTGSLCGVTVVLALTPALTSSSNLQPHTTHALLFGWETVLYYSSIISLVLLTCLKDNRTYFEYEAQPQSINIDPVVRNTPWWTHIPMRQSFSTFLFLGSLVFPGFEIYRAIENLSCFVDETGWLLDFLVLAVCKNTGCIIFCLTQMSFLLKVSHNIIKHRFLKYMHSLTLAANFSLCVDVILNIFYTSGTMELYNKIQNSSTKHISEDILSEQAVYLKCENNTAKPDNAIPFSSNIRISSEQNTPCCPYVF